MKPYTPRPYQTRMTQAILEDDVLLAARPGLGKTAAALDAIAQGIFDRCEFSRVLVVAPKVVASDTWPNEIRKWAPFARLTYRYWGAEDFGYERQERVVAGEVVGQKLRPADAAALRDGVLRDPALIHLVSRDNFYNFVLALGKTFPYDLLVLDESGSFSDLESGRYRAALAVRPLVDRLVELNGTPIGNKLEKLWAQVCLLDGGAALGTDVGRFRMSYMEPNKIDRSRGKVFSWKVREGALAAVIERCRGRIVALREEDWLTLPPMIQNPVFVDIPMGEYRRMARELLLELGGDAQALAVNAGVLYGKLAQLACGIVFDTEKVVHEIHRVKLDALAELDEAHDAPLLIWTRFNPDVARIKRLFPKALEANKVKNLEARWNAGEIRHLIAHPDSLAYGANLQDCPGSAMCWFGITENAEHWNQGIKRLHRSGRTEPVVNYSIVARGTVEEGMIERRMERGALEEDLMAALAFQKEMLR